MKLRLAATYVLFLLPVSLLMEGCGGGSSQVSPPQTAPGPDFTLAVSPSNQTLVAGGSVSVSLSATGKNGFASAITVQISGVPPAVSISAASLTIVPGAPQQVTFSTPANTAYSSASVTFQGTVGSLSHSATLNLSVDSTFGVPGRTRYVRTDATTEYFLWPNQNWIVYNPPTSRFFVTDPSGNHVMVMDALSQAEIASISVPGAYGIDEVPDHSALYVATLVGDVYKIDPFSMIVTQRYPSAGIGTHGYLPFDLEVMADGQLALLGQSGGILSVDGATSFAFWNPANNSFVLFGGANGTPLPCGNIFGFSKTVDRKRVILDTGNALCEVDEATGAIINVPAPSVSTNLVTTPDGKYIIIPSANNAVAEADLYDASTLNLITKVDLGVGYFIVPGFAVSQDSSTLFLLTDTIVYAYSLGNFKLTGWVPNIYVARSGAGGAVGPVNSPFLQAADNTGLFAGPLEEGVGFVDLSKMQTLPVGTGFTNAFLDPPVGLIAGGTKTQWGGVLHGSQGSVYFGSQRATSVSSLSSLTVATTPAGPPGPVTVYAFSTDGGVQMIPDGFSYGPTILEVSPNVATVEGGGTGYIYGYGLGPVNPTSIPSDLQISVGGTPAQITGFSPDAYGVNPHPFPLQFAAFTIPPGMIGPADVRIINNSGSATAQAGFSYLPPIQEFSLPGSTLAQGVYDRYNDLYYFTDTNRVQVFSRTQSKWLTPIAVTAPQGVTQRLWGISLSPDGSKLAISDASASVIYVLNPANPASIATFAVPQQFGFIINACGVAISDSGNVYYAVFAQGGTGAHQFFKLDTNTGAVTDYRVNGPGLGTTDRYLRAAITLDNAHVLFNETGIVFRVNTATDKRSLSRGGTFCCGDYELAVASNQSQVTASSYLYDSALNAQSYYAYNHREIVNVSDVYGAKFSPDGRVLFQPTTNGIDVLDGNLGNLLTRISLPVALAPNYDALVANGTDNMLLAITGTGDGIAVIDLTSLAEPPPLPYARNVDSNSFTELNFGEDLNFEPTLPRGRMPFRGAPHATAPFPRPPNMVR